MNQELSSYFCASSVCELRPRTQHARPRAGTRSTAHPVPRARKDKEERPEPLLDFGPLPSVDARLRIMKLYRLPAESIGDHGRLIDAYLQAPEVRHGDFFYYPNISFSGYQWFSNEIKPWRFIFDENCFIWMMYREDVQQLIERTTLARPVTTVYGPKGSGKSFNLYLLVCHLRVQRNRYRVVYVNQTDFSLSSDLIRNFLSVTYDEIDAPARDMLLELFEIVDNFRTSEEKIL